MPKPITLDLLRSLSPAQLESMYRNAKAAASLEAEEIIELILQHELLERVGGGLKRYHPVIQKIEEITRSDAGVAAAIAAAESGQAPMAGVDPILQERVGPQYGNYDTTSWAGTFVAEEMEAAGWVRHGRRALPPECVARTAAFFKQRETN